MEVHGIRTEARRQEIRCRDCGHTYLIAEGQRGSHCTRCGNIAAHGAEEVTTIVVSAPAVDTLAAFRKTADGKRVEEILGRYQGEWQLWAKVVENFSAPEFHAAYLARVVSTSAISSAVERYRLHHSVMVLHRDQSWQAEVSDLMIQRLEQLAMIRLEQTEGATNLYLRALAFFVNSYPLRARFLRYVWLLLGMAIVLRMMIGS